MSTSKCFCSFDFQKLVLGDQESVGRSDTDIIEWPAGVPVGSKTGGGSDTRYYSYHTRYQIHFIKIKVTIRIHQPCSWFSILVFNIEHWVQYFQSTWSTPTKPHFIHSYILLKLWQYWVDTVAMFVEVTSLQKEEIQKPFLQENKQQFFTYE